MLFSSKTKTKATLAVACLVLLASSQVAAQGFRPEAIHRARLAHALARRQSLIKPNEQVAAQQACGDSYLSSFFGCGIQNFLAAWTTNTSSSTDSDTVDGAERLVEASLGARDGGICLGNLCGVSLVFALLWATFALVMAVVYVMDWKRQPPPQDKLQVEEQQEQEQQAAEPPAKETQEQEQQQDLYQEVTGSRHSMVLRRRPVKNAH